MLTVGPDHTESISSFAIPSLPVQNILYPPCPPPAAEPHRCQTTESQSWTGNCEFAGKNESRTRMKEKEEGNYRVGPEDIGLCQLCIWLPDASLESRTKASAWGKDK